MRIVKSFYKTDTEVLRTSAKDGLVVWRTKGQNRNFHSFARNSRQLLMSELSREMYTFSEKKKRIQISRHEARRDRKNRNTSGMTFHLTDLQKLGYK
jgi:hypothetical protein